MVDWNHKCDQLLSLTFQQLLSSETVVDSISLVPIQNMKFYNVNVCFWVKQKTRSQSSLTGNHNILVSKEYCHQTETLE